MQYVKGNIIDADVDCIVNPVNCKGVMGAGLAKQIANAYPGVLEPYKRVCDEGTLRPGRIQFIRIHRFTGDKDPNSTFFVLNLPTKDDWRHPSKIEWIKEALEKVPDALVARGIKSIAFPKLGSGLGGLDWNEVRPLIERVMNRAPEINTIVYGENATRGTELESSLKSQQDSQHTGSVLNQSRLSGPIDSFTGENAFASNMHPAKVFWGDGLTPEREWPNVEIPYVLAKTLDPQARAEGIRIADTSAFKGAVVSGKSLKKWSKTAPLRPDWEEVKVPLMERLVRDKFTRNPELAARLKATEGRELKEGNYWGDTFWGISQRDIPAKGIKAGEGRNELGRILMNVRSMLEVAPAEHDRSRPMHSADVPKPAMTVPTNDKKFDEHTYAGIGSRETPKEALELMKGIASDLAEKGFILRSGGAEGADAAFERGCDEKQGRKEIFLPWVNFNGRTSSFTEPSAAAVGLSARFHPAWDRLSQGARKLQARNAHQVLGPNLNDKTKVIVCWTENGEIKGGTGQALRMAKHFDIPVVNLGAPRYRSMSRSDIVNEIVNKSKEKDEPRQSTQSANFSKSLGG